jgi:hypothetical protein
MLLVNANDALHPGQGTLLNSWTWHSIIFLVLEVIVIFLQSWTAFYYICQKRKLSYEAYFQIIGLSGGWRVLTFRMQLLSTFAICAQFLDMVW